MPSPARDQRPVELRAVECRDSTCTRRPPTLLPSFAHSPGPGQPGTPGRTPRRGCPATPSSTGGPIWRLAAWNVLAGPVSPTPWHAGMQPCPLVLVDIDLVAVEVFH